MHKQRLKRLDFIYTRCPLYFVTACTHTRVRRLACDEVHQKLIEFAECATERGVWVGRYVVMPDHLHLFAAFRPESLTLSAWIKSLKNTLSKTLRTMATPTPHWQDGFFDHLMRSGESYDEKWRYVRENPVRAGLVARWDDWPYQGEIHQVAFPESL